MGWPVWCLVLDWMDGRSGGTAQAGQEHTRAGNTHATTTTTILATTTATTATTHNACRIRCTHTDTHHTTHTHCCRCAWALFWVAIGRPRPDLMSGLRQPQPMTRAKPSLHHKPGPATATTACHDNSGAFCSASPTRLAL